MKECGKVIASGSKNLHRQSRKRREKNRKEKDEIKDDKKWQSKLRGRRGQAHKLIKVAQ